MVDKIVLEGNLRLPTMCEESILINKSDKPNDYYDLEREMFNFDYKKVRITVELIEEGEN